MARFADFKGNLYPEIGEILVHKTMGHRGIFKGEVLVNRSRKHFQVEAEIQGSKRQLILPAEDWRYTDADD